MNYVVKKEDVHGGSGAISEEKPSRAGDIHPSEGIIQGSSKNLHAKH
jgi:hypothetical protein